MDPKPVKAEQICLICLINHKNFYAGPKLTRNHLTVHYNCIRYTPNPDVDHRKAEKNSSDKKTIYGYSFRDVRAEAHRAANLICVLCKRKGANYGCEYCNRSMHFCCAIERGCKLLFVKNKAIITCWNDCKNKIVEIKACTVRIRRLTGLDTHVHEQQQQSQPQPQPQQQRAKSPNHNTQAQASKEDDKLNTVIANFLEMPFAVNEPNDEDVNNESEPINEEERRASAVNVNELQVEYVVEHSDDDNELSSTFLLVPGEKIDEFGNITDTEAIDENTEQQFVYYYVMPQDVNEDVGDIEDENVFHHNANVDNADEVNVNVNQVEYVQAQDEAEEWGQWGYVFQYDDDEDSANVDDVDDNVNVNEDVQDEAVAEEWGHCGYVFQYDQEQDNATIDVDDNANEQGAASS